MRLRKGLGGADDALPWRLEDSSGKSADVRVSKGIRYKLPKFRRSFLLPPSCKLPEALSIGFLDPSALLINVSVYLKRKIEIEGCSVAPVTNLQCPR